MRFAHTVLIASQALTFAASQAVGRFMYSFGDDTRMAFDVYEGGYIALVYDTRGQPLFIDGTYPLRRTSSDGAYRIDFGHLAERVHRWYQGIEKLSPETNFEPEDLENIEYDSDDSLSAFFEDERRKFTRVGFDVTTGYYEGIHPLSPHITVSAVIGYEAALHTSSYSASPALDLVIICGVRRTDVLSSTLVREEQPYLNFALDSKGIESLVQFRHNVEEVCPEMDVKEADFSRLVFATPDLVYLQIEGARFPLRKKNERGLSVALPPQRAFR
ncbi:hypothetical protein FOZ63_031955 [Perkinsus olseni]|uniref:Uncharacterized protein n=1 Tax=Perkinsus olseni TaxID=32597 RepID=A0A7J6RPK1_PEROL|nr:hypothetical protein FOZ62_028067 [Perkinsus olseni]KAF4750656.1 hypothetical protein FOZ63_031955 [Perkinsus olseni]